MPLTDRQEHLLHEVYSLPYTATTVSMGEPGLASMPPMTELHLSLKDQLQQSILAINLDPFKVERVGEILSEYEQFSLDPSRIDREGYAFRPGNSFRTVQDRLYTYTGIRVSRGGSNRIPLG